MKIEFVKDCYISVYSGIDIDSIPISMEKKVIKGDTYEIKYITYVFKDIAEIQFEDGVLSFIDVGSFEIIEE